MDYRTGAHTKYRIEYHFVWVTKYRFQVLKGDVAERARELIRQTCHRLEIRIVRGVVSRDHVHVLVSAPPALSPAQIMRYVKGRTALKLFEEFPMLKKRFWGRHLWARGYSAVDQRRSVTAGELTGQMIEEYLAHHFEWEDDGGSFGIEP